jgi:hypothetical protein
MVSDLPGDKRAFGRFGRFSRFKMFQTCLPAGRGLKGLNVNLSNNKPAYRQAGNKPSQSLISNP